jgi:hypothetical protein
VIFGNIVCGNIKGEKHGDSSDIKPDSTKWEMKELRNIQNAKAFIL